MTYYQQLIDHLRNRMKESLPGRSAHAKMIPQIRLGEFPEYPLKGIRSSVLLLLFPAGDSANTILILRTSYDGVHSGQIALPGGKYQEEDRDLYHTALREAREEVGVDPGKVELIGKLSDLYIPPSGFLLSPYLAFAEERPDLTPDPSEVEAIIEPDIRQICDGNLKEKDIALHSGRIIRSPYFDINGHVVWGATGMILSEFSELIRDFHAI